MKALVLDGSRERDSLTPVAVMGMTSALAGRGGHVELFKLREIDIAPCAVKCTTSCDTVGTRRRSFSGRCRRPTRKPSGCSPGL